MNESSWLPMAEGNLFQEIKRMCAEAEAKGKKLYRLSIGQPMGAALESARIVAAAEISKDVQVIHEYQDNGSPGCPNFAEQFVRAHLPENTELGDVKFLPTPGTKPMLGLVIAACGVEQLRERLMVLTHTEPGYPTPIVQAGYWGANNLSLTTIPENNFLFRLDGATFIKRHFFDKVLVMINFPHNPTGIIAEKEWLRNVCRICEKRGFRLFNDAAYASLAWNPASTLLAEVVGEFPNLSWAEAFSVSKILGNACSWRVGAIAGSPDFVDDIARVKGETDSGFNPALAAGALHAVKHDQKSIEKIRLMYQERSELLINVLQERGMKLIVKPQAGFFSLWKTPEKAFGQKINGAKHFNQLMIQETGVVGVHFPPYMRYSVCAPLEDLEFLSGVISGFVKAEAKY